MFERKREMVSPLPFLLANRTLILQGGLCWAKNSTLQSPLQLCETMKHGSLANEMLGDITGWGFQESYCSGRKGTYSVVISQKPVVLCPSFHSVVWNTDKATEPGMIESS